MSLDVYKKVVEPKIKGTWNLHQLLPSGMDFFVMLSSISGIVGGHGQANYASANTYLDGFAHYRKMQGETAVSLDIGRMLQVGYIAERMDNFDGAMMDMFAGVSEKELQALLEFFCRPTKDTINERPTQQTSQVIIGIDPPDVIRARGLNMSPWWMEQALFRQLTQVKNHSTNIRADNETNASISDLLAKAQTTNKATELVVQGFASKLERSLGLTAQDFDDSNSLQSYGIDSLNAVELRTWLRTAVGADIPVFDLLSQKSIAQLAEQATAVSSFVPAALKPVVLKVNEMLAE